MNLVSKRALALSGAAAAGFLAVLFIPYLKTAPPAPSFRVLEDEVMTLRFNTDAMTLTAQRSLPGQDFAVHVSYADGRPAEHCRSSPSLAGQLPHFANLAGTRVIPLNLVPARFPKLLARVDIIDRIVQERILPMTFQASADGSSIAMTQGGQAAQVAIAPAAFSTLSAGCKQLALAPERLR